MIRDMAVRTCTALMIMGRVLKSHRTNISTFTNMEKRRWTRIDANLTAMISCEPYQYQVMISNMSEGGVCIRTPMCFPVDTKCNLFISGKHGVLKEEALVKRNTKKEGFNDTMGLELVKPSRKYREFVRALSGDF